MMLILVIIISSLIVLSIVGTVLFFVLKDDNDSIIFSSNYIDISKTAKIYNNYLAYENFYSDNIIENNLYSNYSKDYYINLNSSSIKKLDLFFI